MKNSLLILLLILTLSNCKRDRCSPNYTPENKIDSLKISDSVKAELPDIKNDSFWYASNNGDTAILVCTIIKDVYTEELYQDLGYAGCPKKWLRYHEAIHYEFTTNSKLLYYVKIIVYNVYPENITGLVVPFNSERSSINWASLPFSETDSIFINSEYILGSYLYSNSVLFNKKIGVLKILEKSGITWQLYQFLKRK